MKFLIIFLSIFFLTNNSAFSNEKTDCSHLKKFSIKYTWCKTKKVGGEAKHKLGNFKKNKSSKEQKI